jgi:hypothetical protein
LALVVRYLRAVDSIAGGKSQRSIHPRLSQKVPFFNGLLRHRYLTIEVAACFRTANNARAVCRSFAERVA